MKKILFLLLSTIAMYGQVPADATPLENIQITNNQTSTTATKVNVQENDGTINTKPISELANYLEFASAVNLPVTGEQGKLYLTKDNNRLYRFNGAIYPELTTDISGKEDIANKQNSLAVDGTDTKYPTVTAVNTGLALKANLASPALTGAPTAPTPTTTTGIANKSYVDGLNNGNVKLTGNQTITGQKTFNNSTLLAAVVANNTSTGTGLSVVNSSAGVGIYSNNQSTGNGFSSDNNSTGISIYSTNYQSGNGIVSNQGPSGTGFNYVGQNNGTNTFTVDKFGATTATSFIKSSTPTTNILLAGGGDIAQNTAFNKNFGTTVGTVAQGNDSRILNGQTAFGWGNHSGLYPAKDGTGANGTWGINISGNAANSTLWNGINYDGAFQDQPISYILSRDGSSDTYKRTSDTNVKTWLGLGSNAYSSTAYLPLSGGVLSGSVIVDNGFFQKLSNSAPVALMTSSYAINGGSSTDFNTYVYGNNPFGIWTNNVERLRIGGDGNATFTGTVTASPATLPNHVVVKSQLDAVVARPYKVYTAVLTQQNTDAPSAVVLENTLGGTVVWTRNATGNYYGTLNSAFPIQNKIALFQGGSMWGMLPLKIIRVQYLNSNTIQIFTQQATDGALVDSSLANTSIEIRVYL